MDDIIEAIIDAIVEYVIENPNVPKPVRIVIVLLLFVPLFAISVWGAVSSDSKAGRVILILVALVTLFVIFIMIKEIADS